MTVKGWVLALGLGLGRRRWARGGAIRPAGSDRLRARGCRKISINQ
jgi:hypothetical protein